MLVASVFETWQTLLESIPDGNLCVSTFKDYIEVSKVSAVTDVANFFHWSNYSSFLV